jgi:hypothetical protein
MTKEGSDESTVHIPKERVPGSTVFLQRAAVATPTGSDAQYAPTESSLTDCAMFYPRRNR